jgi:VanZ family protein
MFWSAVIFAFVMASLPQPPVLPGSPSDKLLHVLAFACLGGLGSLAYPAASGIALALALSAFGAIIEVVQLVPALNRDAEVLDWIADTIAAGTVILAIQSWRRVRADT